MQNMKFFAPAAGPDTNLIKLSESSFVVQHNQRFYEGTRKEALHFMRDVVGVHSAQIEVAMEEMLKRDDNLATFGVFKNFIFSQKVDVELYLPARGAA